MQETSEFWPKLLATPHERVIEASTWYDGDLTLRPDQIEIIGGTWTQEWKDGITRSHIKLAVADETGELTPTHDSHPLAPLGQQIRITVTVKAGDFEESLPVGQFRINDAKSTTGWARYRNSWVSSGGKIDLPGVDCIQDLAESEYAVAPQPEPGGTARSEIRRQVEGFCPVHATCTDRAVPSSVIFETNRLNNIVALADSVGAWIAPDRHGTLRIFDPPGQVAVATVTAEAGAKIDVIPTVSRLGIVNAVATEGQQTDPDAIVRGFAMIDTGPRRATGPLHAQMIRHSSSFYQNAGQAHSGADSILARRTANRTIPVTGTVPWNAAWDVGEWHDLELWPGGDIVPALLTRLVTDLLGASMTATWQVEADLIGGDYGR